MIIIVDTNIAFSAILNTKSIIGDLILNSGNVFQFWSCHYLLEEIDKHWVKLKKVSKNIKKTTSIFKAPSLDEIRFKLNSLRKI